MNGRQMAVVGVAVHVNLLLVGTLGYAALEAGLHTQALDDDLVRTCLVRGSDRSRLPADVEVSFERPWVLRLEDRAQGGSALLCEYEAGDDDRPHRVVRVWEAP